MDFFARREFLKTSMAATCSIFVSSGLSACGSSSSKSEESKKENSSFGFLHGVKSGDPLETAVIIWTRITPKENEPNNIPVFFEVAKDKNFKNVVNNGYTYAKKSNDYTVKIDVQGLESYTKYYYRFCAQNNTIYSMVGKTQTLPTLYSTPNQAKMAVFSCSNYPNGYFNAYKQASTIQDLDFTLHLGDYIYEYGQYKDDDFGKKIPGYATRRSFDIGRAFPNDNNKECVKLEDYRKRYALYSTDTGLQAIHAHCPMIVVWDDHEVCNDTYKDGADNHNEDKGEGKFDMRVENALQAYFEWLPIRPITNKRKIYRNFHFGQLLSLHMLETRLFAREQNMGMMDILNVDAIKASTKKLLGDEQKAWLKDEISRSNAIWQVLGQQVIMGRMYLPLPVMRILTGTGVGDLVGAVKEVVDGAYTGKYTQKAKDILRGLIKILREIAVLKRKELNGETLSYFDKKYLHDHYRPYNVDAWDGHHKEREDVLKFIKNKDVNLVVLSGDSHNAWANTLTLDDKTPVGVEFAGTSVSSPGMEDYLGALSEKEIKELEDLATLLVDDLSYCNLKDRGFLEVSFTKDEAKATYHFVNSNDKTTYDMQDDRKTTFIHKAGNKKLKAKS